MASGGKEKKEEDSSGSGWRAGLAVGVGAVALGGLIWVVKKLFDTTPGSGTTEQEYAYNEEKLKEMECYEKSYTSFAQETDDDQAHCKLESRLPRDHFGKTHTAATDTSLHDQLEDYYRKYVDIDEMEMEKARVVVEDIKTMYADHIKQNLEDVSVEMVDSGSTSEGLKVIAPDEFDVMLVVDGNKLLRQISCSRPQVVPGDRQFDDAGGFYFIDLNPPETFTPEARQTSKWPKMAKWVQNNLLSPVLARREFQGLSAQLFSRYTSHKVATSVGGPAVTVRVPYYPGKSLTIDFVPAYRIGDDIFVAKPHPKINSSTPCDEKYHQLWRKTFPSQEKAMVERMHRGGCHTKCLKILKAIAVNHRSDFGNMSSYVFKTLLFNMHNNDPDWPEEELAEHFIDALTNLLHCLEEGELPNNFDDNMNLMTYITPQRREHARSYINRIIKRQAWKELLVVPG